MDITTKRRLRSLAMRAVVVSIGAVAVLAAGVGTAVATIDRTGHHAVRASDSLGQTIRDLDPYAYFPLNGTNADTQGHDGSLTRAGAGASVKHSTSSPAGSTGGSVAFGPTGRQAGQYLRTAPLPAGQHPIHGTTVIWFRINPTLPRWWQTIAAENGAMTGYGPGFYVSNTGRLAYTDSSGTYDPMPGNFGPTKQFISRPLNDGKWHMLAFVDQCNIWASEDGHARPRADWLPSLIYLDGKVVDRTEESNFLEFLSSDRGSRLLIGAGQANQVPTLGKLRGNVSHVAIFDKLLTASQVSAIWHAGN